MKSYKTKGIILKRTNLGEADRIVTVFTENFGKIKFVAKGVRRPKSKLSGSVEPFCFSELTLSEGRSLDILTSAQIINNYLGLKPNLDQVKTAGVIAEIIDKIIPEEMPSNTVFELLQESLANIISCRPLIVRSYFEAKFLNLSGLFPETGICIKCEHKPENTVYFSIQGGGIVCDACKNYFPDSKKINVNVIKALKFSIQNSLKTFARLNLSDQELNELQDLLSEFTQQSLGRTLKSERI